MVRARSSDLAVVPAHEREKVLSLVRQRVAEEGLRPVAREVGMSPTGLQGALEGTAVQNATWRKLETWCIRSMVQHAPAEATDRALAVLLRPVPATHRRDARIRLAHALADIYADYGLPVPAWMHTS